MGAKGDTGSNCSGQSSAISKRETHEDNEETSVRIDRVWGSTEFIPDVLMAEIALAVDKQLFTTLCCKPPRTLLAHRSI